MVSTAQLCLYCKGSRHLCGLERCPLLDAAEKNKKIKIKKEFFGPSSSVFVGRMGYPNVFVGPLGILNNKNLKITDNPEKWFGIDYNKIIEMRSGILRSKYKINVKNKTKFAEENRLIAMSKKPTDIEMKFKGKLLYSMNFSDIVQPIGPSASLKEMKITENVKIKRAVENITNDELKSAEAISILYKKNVDIYKITDIFSVGVLGLNENKKMVPTRWSITATDDILAKSLLEKIRNYKTINDYRVYESNLLNNHFIILLMPGNWEFENFEAWAPGSFWSQNLKKMEITEEYEPFAGRTKYADKQVGGYYATRFGIAEALKKMKRQTRAVVFREIYEGYMVPVGVWQVRENVRNAMKSNYNKFSTRKEALNFIKNKLMVNLDEYLKKSKILKQKRLSDFLFNSI